MQVGGCGDGRNGYSSSVGWERGIENPGGCVKGRSLPIESMEEEIKSARS